MISVGIDQSLACTGVVYLDGGKEKLISTYSFPEKLDFEHFFRMDDVFREIYAVATGMADEASTKVIVAFEGYSFASKGNTLTRLVELGTMLRWIAALNDHAKSYIVAPQNLKKFVAGKTFKKDEMRLEVYKRWNFEHKSNDVVDAYALARYAQAIYNKMHKVNQTLTVFQNQAIDSWLKNKNGVYVDR